MMSLAAASRKRGCTLSCGSEPMAAFTASRAPVASACAAPLVSKLKKTQKRPFSVKLLVLNSSCSLSQNGNGWQ